MMKELPLVLVLAFSIPSTSNASFIPGPVLRAGSMTSLIQFSDAERVWEGIKETTSPAVLSVFISRYGGTRYADLARARLEKIQPKEAPAPISSLKATASADEIIAELPVDAEMLRLVEAHPAFRTDAPIMVESYAQTTTRTEVYGGYRTVMTTDEKTSVKPVRGSLVRFEQLQDDTTLQANVTTRYKRQSLELYAGNGLLELASKTSGVGKPASEQRTTLIRLQSIEGRLFPLQNGNQLSYEAVYRQVDATAPEQFTQRRSCQVVDERRRAVFIRSSRAAPTSCRAPTIARTEEANDTRGIWASLAGPCGWSSSPSWAFGCTLPVSTR